MRTRIISIILIFIGIALVSCRDVNSKRTSQEAIEVNTEESSEAELEHEHAKLRNKIENYLLTEYLTERDLRTISKEQRKYQLYQIDLNNDGNIEIFVNLPTSYFCGTGGCNVLLLTDQLELITEFTVMRTPIYAEDIMENGWRVLMVQSGGKWRKLIYEEDSYPSNPSVVEVSKSSPTKNADILFDNSKGGSKIFSF